MLWNLIHDFFVQHIFGGHTFDGHTFEGFIGNFLINGDYTDESTLSTYVDFNFIYGDNYGGAISHICLGDYLSTTATIVSISIIVILCCFFIYKIIKLIGGLIR